MIVMSVFTLYILVFKQKNKSLKSLVVAVSGIKVARLVSSV